MPRQPQATIEGAFVQKEIGCARPQMEKVRELQKPEPPSREYQIRRHGEKLAQDRRPTEMQWLNSPNFGQRLETR